jgi:hypothetical protein
MLSAATSSVSPLPSDHSSNVFLQSQLARCEAQLSDWITCPSGKTPEGKAIIAKISSKISDIKQRMKQTGGTTDSTRGARVAASPKEGKQLDLYA